MYKLGLHQLRDYAERLVSSFANQIQSEYYGGNISVSIEGIALEHFSAAPQADINSSTLSRPRHAVFHSFLSDDIKRLLCAVVVSASCLLSPDKKSEILHAVDVIV